MHTAFKKSIENIQRSLDAQILKMKAYDADIKRATSNRDEAVVEIKILEDELEVLKEAAKAPA